MDEEYLMFADLDGLYPGHVVCATRPVDWTSLLQASTQLQHQHNQKKKQQSNPDPATTPNLASQSQIQQKPQPSASSHQSHTTSKSATSIGTQAVSLPNGLSTSQSLSPTQLSSATLSLTRSASVTDKLHALLAEPTVNLESLKKLSWAGLPVESRAPVWQLLLGYAPTTAARRHDTLERKRREYREAVDQHYAPRSTQDESPTLSANQMYARHASQDDVTMRQIAVDIPRTSPGQELFQISDVQLALQRVLYVWAMRHPASGYVQGMNDLVTPFMYVFLSEYAQRGEHASIMHASDLSVLKDPVVALANAEADSYWCLTALLNDIQDYYTFSQPGIQRRVHFLRELVSRVDPNLCAHLEEQGLDFLQFAFRWMNCLLMRELPFALIVRVWDTYLAEAEGFAVFHVYVCAALLVSFSEELLEMEFQDLVMFLQNLPTQRWTEKNIDIILSQAYMWRTIFGAAPSHLQ